MKKLISFALVSFAICNLLSSCAATSYMGDQHPATSSVDVFYAAKDVKKQYKVIGHIYAPTSQNAEKVKASIIQKAKTVGADAVIILGLAESGATKDDEVVQQADAVKYTTADQ